MSEAQRQQRVDALRSAAHALATDINFHLRDSNPLHKPDRDDLLLRIAALLVALADFTVTREEDEQ